MENIISLKSVEILRMLMAHKYFPVLIDITIEVVELFHIFNITPTVTSVYRAGDKGVHGHFRGIDFRSWTMTEEMITSICECINHKWEYDPLRPDKICLIHHDVGRGPHLHLQVHPNTILRKE